MADKNNEDTTINLDALSQGTTDEVSEVNDVMGNSDGQTAQPEQVTFEQWLEAQTNLTPEQRQALLDHNADAAVTFSPEAFDGYLAELRSAGVADSVLTNDRPADENQTSGETPAPQDKQNPENTDAPARQQNPENEVVSQEEYRAAIALTRGDLSKLSYEEIRQVWSVLGLLDDKIAQATRPEALQAKLKMADYAEQLMASANPEQPWTMETAPEYSEWLKVSNDIQANNNSQEKKDRNAKIGDSLNKFYQEFDAEYGLSNLTPESAPHLEANQQALEALGKDFDPFAKDEEGKLLHPEFNEIDRFYDKLEIENGNKDFDAVNKDDFKQNMAELAYNEAMLELSLNPDFAKLSKEQQQQLLTEAYATHMQAGMVSLIAAQMAENAAKADPEHPQKPEEFNQQAQEFISAAVKGENNSFKVSNAAALTTLASRTSVLEHVSRRVAQKTGYKSLWSRIKDFDKRLAKKYPKAYPFLKNLAVSSAIGLTTGGVGLAALSVYKTGKAIRDSVKHYREANKDGQYKNWFGYLRKNPKEAIGLAVSVAGTVMSGYMVGLDGLNVNDFGLSGQVYQNGLGNTWDTMKQTVSNAFSGTEPGKDVPWTEKISSWGKRFGEQVAATTQDGQRMARMGISLTGGLSAGAIDMVASFREKDPEKRKELRRNAWKSFGGVLTGSLISLGFTGFMKANNPDSPQAHESPVDGDDFKHQVQPKQEWDANHNGIPDYLERPADKPAHDWLKMPWSNQDESSLSDKPAHNWFRMPWSHQEPPAPEPEPHSFDTARQDDTPRGYHEHPAAETAQENTSFWQNRANKFLGEENTQHIYNMIEKGEIKLPEGIESKEEYAYKLAMDIQQTPAEINQALGHGWQSSAKLTESIKSWTPEDFAKLNGSVDDFSDRGYHNGEIPGSSRTVPSGDEQKTTPTAPEQTVVPPEGGNPKPEEEKPAPAAPEAVRDEAYYQEEKDSLSKPEDEKSLKSQINAARKDENVSVEEQIDTYMSSRVAAGEMSEQQGNEVGNLIKHELDGRDGNQDGKVDDEELSRRDVRRGLKEVDKTLDAMKENAEEVRLAESLQNAAETGTEHPETYSADVKDAKFYEGASKVIHEMRTGDRPASEVMKEAVANGEISDRQAAFMNARDAELRSRGCSEEASLRQMEKDFDRMAKYYEAQNFGTQESEHTNVETPEALNGNKETPVADASKEQTPETPKEETETQRRLDESKQRLGLAETETSNSDPAPVHTLESGGSYSISLEGNKFNVGMKDINISFKDTREFDGLIDVSQDKGGNHFDNRFAQQEKRLIVQNLTVGEKVYDDLMARAGQGESLTEAEQLYLSRHEENLNKYGLAHDREGKIIRSSELSGERSSNQPNPMLRKQKEMD